MAEQACGPRREQYGDDLRERIGEDDRRSAFGDASVPDVEKLKDENPRIHLRGRKRYPQEHPMEARARGSGILFGVDVNPAFRERREERHARDKRTRPTHSNQRRVAIRNTEPRKPYRGVSRLPPIRRNAEENIFQDENLSDRAAMVAVMIRMMMARIRGKNPAENP